MSQRWRSVWQRLMLLQSRPPNQDQVWSGGWLGSTAAVGGIVAGRTRTPTTKDTALSPVHRQKKSQKQHINPPHNGARKIKTSRQKDIGLFFILTYFLSGFGLRPVDLGLWPCTFCRTPPFSLHQLFTVQRVSHAQIVLSNSIMTVSILNSSGWFHAFTSTAVCRLDRIEEWI